MAFATLAALACIGAPSPLLDTALLLGLRDQQGGYRTLLIGRRGVAFVQQERRGEVVIGNTEGIAGLTIKDKTLVGPMRKLTTSIPLRISWVTLDFIGVERDVTMDGKAPFTMVERQVLTFPELDEVPLKQELVDAKSDVIQAAVSEALGIDPPDSAIKYLIDRDWGYLRFEGRWAFVGSVRKPERVEVIVRTGKVTKTPPAESGVAPWKAALRTHADAIDLVFSRDHALAVVVTPEWIYVHESTAASLGKELRKLPAKNETVVSTLWGGYEELDTWQRELGAR